MTQRTGKLLAAVGCQFTYEIQLRADGDDTVSRYADEGGAIVAQDGSTTPISPRTVVCAELAPDGLPSPRQLEQHLALWVELGKI